MKKAASDKNMTPENNGMGVASLEEAQSLPDDDLLLEEKGPLRRCIVTRERLPKETMIRFAIGPDGAVTPDLSARLPGRGMWLSATADMVNKAVAQNAFSKAARKRATAPQDLAARLEALLLSRLAETIGLTRRAGNAVSGFEKVKAELKSGAGGVVLAASDGSLDGRDKIKALAGGLPVITVLNGAELGAAFGRDHTVHAFVRTGKLAEKLLIDAGRLAGFRGRSGGDSSPVEESKTNI